MLAGRKERRDVPHEPEQWIEFRTLSGAQLDEAEEMQTQRSLAMVKGLDVSAVQAMSSQSSDQRREQAESQKYDKDTLVRFGVFAWSLGEPCTDENKALLDAETRDWAVEQILEMNVRPLATSSGSSETSNGAGSEPKSLAQLVSSTEE